MHDLLDRAVCFRVDLVEILSEAIGEACALLARAFERKVAVGLAGEGSGVAVAFGAEAVHRLTGLLGRYFCGF
ncbi:hypothetical protein [Mycobacterium avium]|uniref:hypothetical protein n=1 Tax=Mycobacterium avium TaxID=1764 RepID=UPI0020D251FD|nr:hypothetical protein [Mycobacterium avium]